MYFKYLIRNISRRAGSFKNLKSQISTSPTKTINDSPNFMKSPVVDLFVLFTLFSAVYIGANSRGISNKDIKE